jgi:hypothetical protein
LLKDELNLKNFYFYDLKNNKLVEEKFFIQKLEVLQNHLNDLKEIKKIKADKCEDLSVCKHCEYKIICKRD